MQGWIRGFRDVVLEIEPLDCRSFSSALTNQAQLSPGGIISPGIRMEGMFTLPRGISHILSIWILHLAANNVLSSQPCNSHLSIPQISPYFFTTQLIQRYPWSLPAHTWLVPTCPPHPTTRHTDLLTHSSVQQSACRRKAQSCSRRRNGLVGRLHNAGEVKRMWAEGYGS